ncbi:MAG: hypothetical protein EOL97_14480 [Spirochaetia bacterium]|nr:hypothetical protein [Spirochaetia bacterium]
MSNRKLDWLDWLGAFNNIDYDEKDKFIIHEKDKNILQQFKDQLLEEVEQKDRRIEELEIQNKKLNTDWCEHYAEILGLRRTISLLTQAKDSLEKDLEQSQTKLAIDKLEELKQLIKENSLTYDGFDAPAMALMHLTFQETINI